MMIDSHYHVMPALQSVEDLLAQMQSLGVERVALIAPGVGAFSVDRLRAFLVPGMARLFMLKMKKPALKYYREIKTPDNRFNCLGNTAEIFNTPDNDGVGRLLQAYPQRFYGWVFANPRIADPLAEAERLSASPGWIGVKALPYWHGYGLDQLDDAAAWCESKGWPMLVHLGPDRADGDYTYLPERHPRLKLIYAHAGIPCYPEIWDYVRRKPNLFIDLSNPYYVDVFVRRAALKALGPAKCLYGTDGPYGSSVLATTLPLFERLRLPPGDQQRLLGENFRELICG